MGWMVWGLNPGVGTRFSAPVQTGSGAHPDSCTTGAGFLSRLSDGRGWMSWPVSGWYFGSWSVVVYTASVPLSGWSRVQIVVGTKIFLFSKTTRPDSLPGLNWAGCEVHHWHPSSPKVRVELYLFSPYLSSQRWWGKLCYFVVLFSQPWPFSVYVPVE